ncbi:hypothetical protein chiPu_0024288, partial [Chiloscyllium punctatum]|nr:hypothetical protein [Chiloscyllium punctatum]
MRLASLPGNELWRRQAESRAPDASDWSAASVHRSRVEFPASDWRPEPSIVWGGRVLCAVPGADWRVPVFVEGGWEEEGRAERPHPGASAESPMSLLIHRVRRPEGARGRDEAGGLGGSPERGGPEPERGRDRDQDQGQGPDGDGDAKELRLTLMEEVL